MSSCWCYLCPLCDAAVRQWERVWSMDFVPPQCCCGPLRKWIPDLRFPSNHHGHLQLLALWIVWCLSGNITTLFLSCFSLFISFFKLFSFFFLQSCLSLSHRVWMNCVFVGMREACVEQDRHRRPEASRRLQTDSLHLSGCGAPPPVSHHALCHRGALPTVATETAPGQPPQHLSHPLPRKLRGECMLKL